jgi:hypothetical protein
LHRFNFEALVRRGEEVEFLEATRWERQNREPVVNNFKNVALIIGIKHSHNDEKPLVTLIIRDLDLTVH